MNTDYKEALILSNAMPVISHFIDKNGYLYDADDMKIRAKLDCGSLVYYVKQYGVKIYLAPVYAKTK